MLPRQPALQAKQWAYRTETCHNRYAPGRVPAAEGVKDEGSHQPDNEDAHHKPCVCRSRDVLPVTEPRPAAFY